MSFYLIDPVDTKKVDKKVSLYESANKFGCDICSLKNLPNKNPKIEPMGTNKPIIYILGEYPELEDDSKGKPFTGNNGLLLKDILHKVCSNLGYSNYAEITRYNLCIRCGTKDNKKPTQLEVECCKPSLIKDIEETKPLIIFGLGSIPLNLFVKGNSITLWRNRIIPVKVGQHKCWYAPMLSPSFVLENQSNYENRFDRAFEHDLINALNFLSNYVEPVVVDDFDEGVEFVLGNKEEDIDKIESRLSSFINDEIVCVDIETEGLKPYKGNRWITNAISNESLNFSYPTDHPKAWNFGSNRKAVVDKIFSLTKNFLKSSKTKIAHNLKFELEWFYYTFKSKDMLFDNLWEDTMSQAYIIDERTSKSEKMLSLDRLTQIRFGFNLKEKSPVDSSKLLKYPIDKVLKYNAMDTKWTRKLFFAQKEVGYNNINYRNLVDTAVTIAITQNEGVPINISLATEYHKRYGDELEELIVNINKVKEVKQFIIEKGEFNPLSPYHLSHIFYKLMKLKAVKFTETGKNSVDDEVLTKLAEKNIKLASYIMKYREVNKLKSTYVDPLIELNIDGIVNSNFNVLYTTSGRLSSGKEVS
jgi:uracil-DNA glycosylase family 4